MVIPVHDRNPTRRTPYVTWTLIALNIVVFLISPSARASLPGSSTQSLCEEQAFYDRWGAIPTELTHNEALPDTVGAAAAPGACFRTLRDYDKTPVLSAVTSMFVHAGWLHLLGNMLFLLIFGNNVEDRLGRLKFLLVYVAIGVAAAYGFALTRPDSTTTLVGASGAIAGVLGAYLVMFPRAKVMALVPFLFFIPLRLPAWAVLASWFVLQAFYASGAGTSGGGVAYLVHVIGFVLGMAVAFALPRSMRAPPQPRYRW